jgi:hypothetical protein
VSKFEEMCAAFVKGDKERDAYEQRCLRNLAQLAQGFSTYCAFPNGTLKVVPLEKEIDHNTKYFVPAAAHESDDCFWNEAYGSH